ncbi:MAG: ABC transporter permease [Sphaerochaetaceae bacterium]|jgi:oligopeptide transport system permease protein|nr:ABC transporter permease [Sphaerochaetaceae bacterium]HHU88766.1 ABC transporter permease [Spirochaetales bacterium]
MNLLNKQAEPQATNEFDQVIVGNSLSKDAWRRLKKNKMAVISVFIVIIYVLLAICAPILPIYPYDEIILDHQHLKPSLVKNAGQLLMEKRMADLYTQAWREGRFELSEEKDDMIWAWIDKGEVNKVWDYMYKEGNIRMAEGTFVFNTAEQRRIDTLNTKLKTDLQISVKKVWYTPEGGKRINISKLPLEEIVAIYADMVGTTSEIETEQYGREIEQQLLKTIMRQNPDLTTEEYNLLLDKELSGLSERKRDTLIRENIVAKITSQAKDIALFDLKEAAGNESVNFPLNKEITIKGALSASVKATKMHERRYYLGTDHQGRDLLSRIIYGGQVSIAIGFIGTITSVLIGTILGALAGYLGGKIDYFIMRVVDIMYGLPYMLLVIIAMAIFGRNIINLFFALAIISWLTISRMVRGQIMSLKNQEFIEAARSMGAPTRRIIFRHLIPNSLSVIIVFSTLRIPSFIMTESFLSFLGLGVQAPYASWGSLVGDAVAGMTLYPWKLFFPALAMTIFLFAMNFLGDGLRDAFDPQSKNQL